MIQKLKFCIDSNPIFPYKKIQQRNEKYHDPVDKSKNAFTEAKAFFENRLTGFFNQFVKDLNLFFRTRVIIAQRKRNVHLLIF